MSKQFAPNDRVSVMHNFRAHAGLVRSTSRRMVTVLLDGEQYGRTFPAEMVTLLKRGEQ